MIEYSVFSSGLTNISIAIAELFKGLGHSVTLLNVHGNRPWWDDCQPIQKVYEIVHVNDISGSNVPQKFDIIFEVDKLLLKSPMRSQLTTSSVWILRKPFVLTEIESTIYPIIVQQRDLSGVNQVWLLTDVTSPDDKTVVETLSRLPVITIPYVWTPILAEIHTRTIGAGQWKGSASAKINVRMADTNQSSSSSSTIPLVMLRELARRKYPISSWVLHNGEHIAKSRFFRDNVLKHCSDLDLSGSCVGRQRCVDWVRDENTVALVHLRFNRLRPILLDLAWTGIPVVHNSPALRDMGCGAERLYYSDNSIEQGAFAFETLLKDLKTTSGWFSNYAERRERILRLWSPISPEVRSAWANALERVTGISGSDPVPVAPSPVTTEQVSSLETTKNEFTVVFSDMWDEFQPNYNFFTLLLNEAGASMVPPRTVVGIDEKNYPAGTRPDLVVFGPFGNNWQRFMGVPKVHFTGENTRPIFNKEVDLNLGFDHVNMIPTHKYMRIPLWMTFINWFGADVEKLVNPKPLPLECCTRTYETTLESRKKFCAFIVTNPKNIIRNQSFHWLNQYKPVDSAGHLYNTVGHELLALRGGGGGEHKKTKFLMDYKFCLTYENASQTGYCTEKFLHAKAAGAVPIYWGDPEAQRDIAMGGVIDARNVKSPSELIEIVKAIDTDDELWRKKASEPALNEYMVERTRRTLSELSRQMWKLLGFNEAEVRAIPNMLGATAGSDRAKIGMDFFRGTQAVPPEVAPQASPSPPVTSESIAISSSPPVTSESIVVASSPPIKPEVPLPVTYVTWSFLGSLQHWLSSLNTQRQAFPDLSVLVFVGADVPDETLGAIREKYTFATFERVPTTTPPNFPDFWESTNFGWKLWIYHTVVNRESLKGKMILYMDAGSVLCRWPVQWMLKAQEHGISCLEDSREDNDRWCVPTFCDLMQVTEEERQQKQIVAGILCFRSGHELATRFFDTAYKFAQDRNVLVGPRLSGVDSTGKSYGHRQDQSILSILVRRFPIPLYPLDAVYGDKSMRKTFEARQAIYVHRGNFQKHIQFLPGIDDAYVINLDRRADRLEKFWTTHPELKDRVERWEATDGRQLTLTPELTKMFAPNDFYWKKAVMGCAISHLGLWWKLVNEHPDIKNFLIFEDDAKLMPGWQEVVSNSMEDAPEDYDVLYLGGILPPNRNGYEKLLEPVTKSYSRIRPHQFFGQKEPTRYFHSCAYAYILSRKGAFKIMEAIQEKSGYWTSADHMMCSPCDKMNLYFLSKSVAGCFQDDDPNYANSDFNNFSRVDKFDSDLWNNDERFNRDEIGKELKVLQGTPFEASELLRSIFNKKKDLKTVPEAVSESVSEAVPLKPVVETPLEIIAELPVELVAEPHSLKATTINAKGEEIPNVRFICLAEHKLDFSKLYESEWLFSLFGGLKNVVIEYVDETTPVPTDCPIFILQRPHVLKATQFLLEWAKKGGRFKLLHMSDEMTMIGQADPLLLYKLPNCVSVLRTYIRDDFPPGTESKIKVIPLGYRWSPLKLGKNPLKSTPQLPFRENHWCFFGTDWNGRSDLLKPLIMARLFNSYKFYPTWNDASALSKAEYIKEMTNSIFVPCPDGINPETFRFYEALEAGCIPLIVKTEKNAAWFKWVSNYIPLVANDSWEDAVRIMYTLITKPERLEIYREQILNGWVAWTNSLRQQAQEWLPLSAGY